MNDDTFASSESGSAVHEPVDLLLDFEAPTPRPTPRRLSAPMYCETKSLTWA
ncbi:hypothetical protein [Kitasatospora sp. NPDC056531]|uniref:hypothetical protein n=1 Tax=Kitasatospora sp. NPDC056531 TaxID=3345856 RepID=UPI0036B27663